MPNPTHRAPPGPWKRTFALALAVLLVVFAVIEVTFRARGMTPAYQDTPRHWGYWRMQADRGGSSTVALLGSSRTQLGVDPESMAKGYPDRTFVQLAMNGATPLPVLTSLAADEDFVGTAIVEGYPSALFMEDEDRRKNMQAFLRAFEGRSSIEDVEARLRALLQGSLVLARPDFRPTLFLVTLLTTRALPTDGYVHMQFSRWTRADYELKKKHEPWSITVDEILPDEQLSKRFERIEAEVARIEARGGDVLFFRMPSSGRVRELEREHLPRARYWDRWMARFGDRAHHFEDVPELAGYECPDGSHLDFRSVEGFSRGLARHLFAPGEASDATSNATKVLDN